ncbi:MAG TPA: Ig-like domain-containing protein [Pseudonocardiaceae bacterium]
MFEHRLLRAAAAGLATLVAAGTVSLLGAASANAAVVGTLTPSLANGLDTTPFSLTTSAACPGGTNLSILLTGSGFPAAGVNAVANTAQSIYQTTASGGLVVPLTETMRQYANDNGVTTLTGQYNFDLMCRGAFGATSFGDFTGSVWFTDNTHWQSTNPNAATPTTTTVSPSPASPVTVGTAVTFTATVAPAAAAGTVQFADGGTALGAPVTVAAGTAAFTTSTLTAGSHSITAAFTPSGTGFSASTSTAVTYVVNPGAATPTTTALAVSPANTAAQFSTVALTATVSPTAAAGTVQFADGGTALGAPVTVTGGTATFSSSTLAVGAHSFTATFTPANTTAYVGSASAAIPFSITAFTGSTASETITTTVVPGSLVISVPDGQVTLPSPTLDSAGDLFTTTGTLKPVTVTDTRAGNPGWTVSGQVNDFSDGQSHAISGENLGWTPSVVDNSTAQTVTMGASVSAANGVAPGDNGTAGLKQSRTLATGTGLGTTHLSASLVLNVPTTTVAGTYTATLTLTAI